MHELPLAGRCENCEHWGESTDVHRLPSERPTWRSCHRMAAWCLRPIKPPTLAFAFETGEADSQVLTSPEFGCVMFQSRGER